MKPFLGLVFLLLSTAQAGPATELCSGQVHSYVIEIKGADSAALNFEGAVGGNGELQTLRAKTPHRVELSTAKIVAMFASKTKGTKLTVTLYGKEGDKLEQLGMITEEAPLILENVACPESPRAFGRL